MRKNKDIMEHLNDFGKGMYEAFVVTPYNFGDFLGRISGLRDWQDKSVIIKDYYQQEAIEEVKLFWRGIKSIDSLDKVETLFDLAKNEIKNRPMYYLGSFAFFGLMSSTIKTGSKAGNIVAKGAFTTTMTSTKILANIHEFYPNFKTIKNDICSLYNNKSYTNLFKQDMIMCSFLQNDNQKSTLQPQDLQQKMQRLYYNIQKTNINFNSYKSIPIASFANPKAAYIQKINPDDIQSLTPNSPLYLLKALYFCEDYALLDSNKEPLLKESNWQDFYSHKDDFYIIFISQKAVLTQEYIDERIVLYKAIMKIRKERQEQELQELKKQQEILEQSLQDLNPKQRESKLQDLQKQQEKQLRDKQRQEQQQARFNKDSYLILESQDKSIVIIFLDKLDSKDLNKNISMSNLIHIHNNKINIFTKDKTYLDIQSLLQDYQDYGITQDSFNSLNTQIFFYSHLLLGSTEIESNPLFFGELDKDNIIKQDIPAYQFSPKDEEYNLGTLRIFLNSYTLTLLNYSLLDSSLNIKLELTNKESKDLRDKAIIQRKQTQEQEQTKTTTSTAMLCSTNSKNITKEYLKNFKYNQSIINHHWRIINAA